MSLSYNELNKISRFLIKLLRHNASDYNLVLDKDGFIECRKLLKLPRLNNITTNNII
jgi:RNA:NAD 2'-phosphotransferase (TPT1/KptA family)